MAKKGRYANGALISSAKADMQTDKAIAIRRAADEHRNKGTVGDGMDYSHRDGKLVAEGTHRSKDKKLKPNKRKLHIT